MTIKMGVDISPIISDYKKEIGYNDLVQRTVAIDAFNQIYQFLATIRGPDGDPLKNLSGEITSHLVGLYNRTSRLLENDIKPIFIFDGEINELKHTEIERRRAIKTEARLKMESALDEGDYKSAKKYASMTSKINPQIIESAKKLLSAMGCPIIQAKQDGEAQAAYLVQNNIAWSVGSQDYDTLLFGAPRLVRNLSMSGIRKFRNTTIEVKLEYYTLEKVLRELEITREQLVDVGILIGVDFFEGIQGVGAKTAIKLIKEHGNIENLMNKKIEVRKAPIEIDLELLNKIRDVFLKPQVNVDFEQPDWKKPDQDKLNELLVEENNFSKERVEKVIQKVMSKYKGGRQSSLFGYV
jgi:flap endonuclease-1